jgi:hypothetical protein
MKVRRFYPRQVLRTLDGRAVTDLGAGEQCALRYFLRRSRKLGQQIAVLRAPAGLSVLERASTRERLSILMNSNLRVFLQIPSALQNVGAV